MYAVILICQFSIHQILIWKRSKKLVNYYFCFKGKCNTCFNMTDPVNNISYINVFRIND